MKSNWGRDDLEFYRFRKFEFQLNEQLWSLFQNGKKNFNIFSRSRMTITKFCFNHVKRQPQALGWWCLFVGREAHHISIIIIWNWMLNQRNAIKHTRCSRILRCYTISVKKIDPCSDDVTDFPAQHLFHNEFATTTKLLSVLIGEQQRRNFIVDAGTEFVNRFAISKSIGSCCYRRI